MRNPPTPFLDEHGVTHIHVFGLDRMHMVCGYLSWKKDEMRYGHANARGEHPTCLWCVIRRNLAR